VTLRIALVGGPMYDHLYRLFDEPGWPNAEVAARLGAGERLDVIATHSKYAPSQAAWLRPLDELSDGSVDTSELAPLAVDLCRFAGRQWCVPRLVDVRILWAHGDRLPEPPGSWAAWASGDAVLGFPGRESGLFGTFFELVVGAGGRLFDDHGRPCIDSPEAVAAVETLCALTTKAPADLPDWHYDQVDRALLDGRVDAAGAWPGGWGAIREVASLEPHPYPSGASRRVSYAGCHAWAIPTTCGDVPGARELVRLLTSQRAGAVDAAGGSVCAHVGAFAEVQPSDDRDRRRLAITADTIATAMITYPPHERFPELEDAGWRAVRDALRGERTPADAVAEVQRVAERVLGG
jgi:multiple sugar transport system substrate-binding protein